MSKIWTYKGEALYICYSPKNCKYEHLAHRTWKKDHAVKHHGNHSNSSEAQKLNQTGKQLLSAGSGTGQEGAATLWMALQTLLGGLLVGLMFELDMMIKRCHTFKNCLCDLWWESLHFDHYVASKVFWILHDVWWIVHMRWFIFGFFPMTLWSSLLILNETECELIMQKSPKFIWKYPREYFKRKNNSVFVLADCWTA